MCAYDASTGTTSSYGKHWNDYRPWWAGGVHSSMSQVRECVYEWVNADLTVKHFEWLLMKNIIRNIILHFVPLKPSHWSFKSKSLIVFYHRWQGVIVEKLSCSGFHVKSWHSHLWHFFWQWYSATGLQPTNKSKLTGAEHNQQTPGRHANRKGEQPSSW